MTDLEISKALALAIGWKEHQIEHHVVNKFIAVTIEDNGDYTVWKEFDYRDWHVAGPIAKKYDAFPKKLVSMKGWWADVFGKDARFANTPQKAIALAVIGGKHD